MSAAYIDIVMSAAYIDIVMSLAANVYALYVIFKTCNFYAHINFLVQFFSLKMANGCRNMWQTEHVQLTYNILCILSAFVGKHRRFEYLQNLSHKQY
jgi:hypothetical protein